MFVRFPFACSLPWKYGLLTRSVFSRVAYILDDLWRRGTRTAGMVSLGVSFKICLVTSAERAVTPTGKLAPRGILS
jgi:hypothetical protein